MVKRAFLLLLSFLLISANCCILNNRVAAQGWTKLHSFDGYICLAKFIDQNTGFVGLGVSPGKNLSSPVELFKTTNGGQSWITCTTPTGYGGQIGDLLMVDSLHGWVAMTAWGGSGNKALWRTSDAGVTWTETQLVGSGTSVQITPSAMLVTDIIGNGHISTDGGNTFFDGFLNSTNCVNFVDALHGMISDYRGENWLVSADGGLSWQNSAMNVESWTVYPDSGTSNFFAAPEGPTNGQTYHGIIYHSTDYGFTWSQLAQFPFIFTGHLTGLGDKYLFFQVQDVNNTVSGVTYNGFYYSTDQGVSWTGIGGPSGHNDTRFSVLNLCSGVALYGFDDQSPGSLYQYSFGSGNTSGMAQIHREAASAYVSQLDTLTLGVDISSQINIDSLWPYITEIQATYSWDSSVAKYYEYVPPANWSLNGLANHGSAVDIDIVNAGSSPTQPMNLGTAIFRPNTTQLATTWVELPDFVINVGNTATSLCVTDNEDNHWAVKTLGTLSGVSEVPTPAQDISIYPNPAEDEVFVMNPNDFTLSIGIYDVIGREMMTANVEAVSTSSINIGSLPNGDYFLTFHMNGHTEMHSITKE